LRLAYSGVTPEEIEEGVKRLADAYRHVIEAENVNAA
jgi:DNA-binding transcriptional MocR family regulator